MICVLSVIFLFVSNTKLKNNEKKTSLVLKEIQEVGMSFDNSAFESVLRNYVSSGKVDYKSLKENSGNLDSYLNQIAVLEKEQISDFSVNEQIALYVNAYNAYTLKSIITNYPVRSIRDIPSVWDKPIAVVAGEKHTLNEIEHVILRPNYSEPRLHFALNCASVGCPDLRNEPYLAKKLDAQLEEQTRLFINDDKRNYYDNKKNIFFRSSIFKWFKEDFGDVELFILKYIASDREEYFNEGRKKVKFFYDWSLNDIN